MHRKEAKTVEANQKKKILIVSPVVKSAGNEIVAKLEKYLAPGFELHHTNVQSG